MLNIKKLPFHFGFVLYNTTFHPTFDYTAYLIIPIANFSSISGWYVSGIKLTMAEEENKKTP